MSETRQEATRRESTDFSIARILAKDPQPSSSASTVERTCAAIVQPGAATAFAFHTKFQWFKKFCAVRSPETNSDKAGDAASEDVPNSYSTESAKQTIKLDPGQFDGEKLSWLRCTRYRPPKLPRKSCAGKSIKRKPGPHPRIPFTKYQLEVLEEKYKINAYLSRKDVIHLSNLLHLPQSRIKIWFQNRRARERRESQTHEQTELSSN